MMKKILLGLVLTLSLSFLALSAEGGKSGVLYHVVAFKFKESATKEQIQKVEKDFGNLKQKISQIQTLEWGTNVSPEKLNKGFTHGFVLTFKSDKDRDDYLVHPDHKAFGGSLKGVLEDAFVVDFWSQK